jgi:hypothetical protein
VTEAPLLGIDWTPESVEYAEGKSITTAELVKQAFEASGYTVVEWNAQSENDVQAAIEVQLALLTPAPETESQAPDADADIAKEAAPINTPVLSSPPVKNQTKAEKKAALKAKKAALGQR